jgi:hypothetical protein
MDRSDHHGRRSDQPVRLVQENRDLKGGLRPSFFLSLRRNYENGILL